MEMVVQGYALGKVDIQEDLKLVDPEDGRRSEKGKAGISPTKDCLSTLPYS